MANAWRHPALGGKSPVKARLTNLSRGSAYAALAEAAYFGAASSAVVKSYTGSGALAASGTAALARSRSFSGSGAMVMAGAAALARSRAVSGTGLVISAGAALSLKQTATQTFTYAALGQAVMAGSAGLARAWNYPASGALASSGSAGLARAKAYSASGGAAISGSAALARIKTYTASGAVDASGLASMARSKACSGSGEVVAAGSAGLSIARSIAGTGQLEAGASASVARTFDFVSSGGQSVTSGTAEARLARVYLWQASGSTEAAGNAGLSRTWVPEIDWFAPLALNFAGAWTPPSGNAVVLDFSAPARGILLSGAALTQQVVPAVQYAYQASGGAALAGEGVTGMAAYAFTASVTAGMPAMQPRRATPVVKACIGAGKIGLAGSARVMRVIVGGAQGALMDSQGSAAVSVTRAHVAQVTPDFALSGSASASFGFDPEAEAILLLLAA